jgi:hypothetical protein
VPQLGILEDNEDVDGSQKRDLQRQLMVAMHAAQYHNSHFLIKSRESMLRIYAYLQLLLLRAHGPRQPLQNNPPNLLEPQRLRPTRRPLIGLKAPVRRRFPPRRCCFSAHRDGSVNTLVRHA